MKFKEKIALVTGAASGIGRATAQLLAAEGAWVACVDIDGSKCGETVQLITASGGRARDYVCDVSSYQQQKEVIVQVIEEQGSLDLAVNNAGIGGEFSNITEYSHETYDQVIAVNQTAVFYGMQLQLQAMVKQQAGSIVNVASMAGLRAQPKTSAYVASKHAVIGLTKTAALENAKHGIRVNAVCPVYTMTPMVESMFEYKSNLKERLRQTIPLKRYGTAQDIAEAIAWLCSDAASFSTGLVLPLDGGLSA